MKTGVHEQSVVLVEEPIEQGVDKREAELTAAPRVLAGLDWVNASKTELSAV